MNEILAIVREELTHIAAGLQKELEQLREIAEAHDYVQCRGCRRYVQSEDFVSVQDFRSGALDHKCPHCGRFQE